MLTMTMLLASLTIPVEAGAHPYDVALEYCQDRGGLAQYTDRGDEVEFSCGDEPDRTLILGWNG